ncbi:MAG: hypothetical protein EBV06_14015 [Planctomycetia bacterium]|nr:hypothetical protein [Planctomycetia bacterium]
MGFLPEAFTNMLAMLGWNDGTAQELFTMDELISRFSIERVHKGGAKFDFEKAKWFNHQYIQKADNAYLAKLALPFYQQAGLTPDNELLLQVIPLIKERCTLLKDFPEQSAYFFKAPETIDTTGVKEKWTSEKQAFFQTWMQALAEISHWDDATLEQHFNDAAAAAGIKKGELMLPLRVMLVGGKFGAGVFHIAHIIGREQTIARIGTALQVLQP